MPDVDQRIKDALRNAGDTFEPAEPLSLPKVRNRARALRAQTIVWVLVVALFIASGAVIGTRITAQKGSLIGPTEKNKVDPNYTITVAVAKQLADGAAVPPGSVRSAAPLSRLPLGEAPGGDSHFIDTTRWWVTPMSVTGTFKWIARHGPGNLRYTASGVGGENHYIDFHIADDTSQAYTDRAIEYTMARIDGGHTALRVDGTALWLTTAPVPDRLGKPAIRVTIAGGCPLSLAGYHDIINPRSEDLLHQVVPSADPTSALRCSYLDAPYGRTKRAPKLNSQTILGRDTVRKLAGQLRTLKVGFNGGGIGSCGLSLPGTHLTEILVLSYPGGREVDLWYGIECRGFIVNGFVKADDPITP